VLNGFSRHFLSTSDRKARVFYAFSVFLQALFVYKLAKHATKRVLLERRPLEMGVINFKAANTKEKIFF